MSDQLSKADLKLLQDVVSNILWSNGGTYAEEVQAIIDRIESAAAPVEVELPEPVSSMSLAAWGPKPDYYTADKMREYASAYAATLARQLAEERALSTAISNDCNAVANERNALRDQLAAATRRVAEVEAERDALRQAAHGLRFDVFSLTTHELQAAFDGKQSIAVVDMDTVAALKSALQKEPK